MVEVENKNKAVQYWSHVFKAGVVLFNNPASHQDTLKSLIETVLSSKLLCEIECLSANELDELCPVPLTAWLLDGMFGAAVSGAPDDFSGKDFFVESQIKLVEATYDRSSYDYVQLAKMYLHTLGTLCEVELHSPFHCLVKKNYELINSALIPAAFTLSSEKQRLRFLDVLLNVLEGTHQIFLHCCSLDGRWKRHPLRTELWDEILALVKLENPELILLALPFISSMIPSLSCDRAIGELQTQSEVYCHLQSALPASQLGLLASKTAFLDIWEALKKTVPLNSVQRKSMIEALLQCKTSCQMQGFVASELGHLMTQVSGPEQSALLQECTTWPLSDKVLLYQASIVKSIKNSTNHPFPGEFQVKAVSQHWNELLPAIVELVSSDTVNYRRINNLNVILTALTQIVGQVDEEKVLWQNHITLQFFGGDYGVVLRCVVAHLADSISLVSKVAADALSHLLNLPEFGAAADCPKVVQQALSEVSRLLSQEPADNPNGVFWKVRLLKSLQRVPSGIMPAACVTHFANAVSKMNEEVEVSLQAVKSVPFLFLSGLTSPAQLIADILTPAMLSETDEIQVAVLDAASSLVCAVAGTGRVLRSVTGENTIHCDECGSSAPRGIQENDAQRAIDSHLVKLFEPMFRSTPKVRCRFLAILPKLSTHVRCLRSPEFLSKLLSFISDPDVGTRRDFGNVVTTAIFGCAAAIPGGVGKPGSHEDVPGITATALNLFFVKMEEEINSQLAAEQWGERLQGLLTTLTNVACYPDPAVRLRSIKLMLFFVGNCPLPLSSMASSIAAAHKTSSLALYHSFLPELSQFFGELLVKNQVQFGCPAVLTLSSIILFFNGLSKVRFASGSEQYMLPLLIAAIAKQPDLSKLLVDYADYVGVAVPVILTRSFQNIYVYIWLNESEKVFSDAMRIVEQAMNVKVSDLTMHSQKMIIHQFLFHYNQDEAKVLNGLMKALCLSPSRGISIKELIASNLESRFVGYLLFLVGKFTKDSCGDKVQALKSLSSVLPLMGMRRVTPVSRKVLATLKTTLTLDRKKHAVLQCNAWEAFIRTVQSREIGPLLATIVVSLLLFLDEAEDTVVRLLTYLLVEQKSAVEEFLPAITFLPKHPSLSYINASIRSYVSFENEDIKERLSREMALALHETVGVGVEGLRALQTTLRTASEEVQTLINGSDEPAPCVTALWEALVTCCRDADSSISLAAAACLGELGAIDPGLLPRKLKPREALPLSVHDPEFGYLALCEIVRGFQNARTSVDMDAFAIGIQELLKIYSVTEAEDNKTWNRFSAADLALLRPMLTSRYKVQAPARTTWPDAIFVSREASSHMKWAALWAGKLIARCSDARAVVLFRACEPSIKRDPKVLLFFLQYIVLHVLIQDALAHAVIWDEIMAVLSWSPAHAQPRAPSVPVRLIESCGYPLIRSSMSGVDARACAMTVFLLIDFLYHWTRSYLVKNFMATGEHLRKRDYTLVKDFLTKIDLGNMASANYEMQEYPRAIQCWEDSARNNAEKLVEHLPLLSKAYARYGDLDSVGGARALQVSAPDVEDQLFYHQVSHQMEEVRIVYEQLGKAGKMTPSQVEGMVLCNLRLGEPSTAYSHIMKNFSDPPEMSLILTESLCECLTKLGDWTSLDAFLKTEIGAQEKSWYTQLGRITLDLDKGDLFQVNNHVDQARSVLVDNFTSLGMQSGNEHQGYHCLVKLQILNEVEKVRDIVTMTQTQETVRPVLQKLFNHWEAKTSFVQSDSECLEDILSTRRTLLTVLSRKVPENTQQLISEELGKCWIKSADIARKAGCFHQAYNYILSAEQYNIPLTFIQKAQLFWDKGDQEESLLTLTRGIATNFPDAETMKSLPIDERLEERKMTAEAKLLYAAYNEETSNCSSYTNMTNYQDAFDVCRQLEKTQALLAQCLDRGLALIDERELGESKACDLRVMMVSNFGKSLMNGCEFIYQTVPRMLTIWLDLGDNLSTPERARAMAKINKLIQIFAEKLPPFIFMTALPQLLSRIGHQNREVFLLLKSILVTLIRAFPQQCLWAIQTVAKSSVPERSMRYKEVIQDPALRSTSVFKLIEDFTSLCDKLNRLTNKNLPQDSINRGLSVSSVVRDLPLLLNSDGFSRVIVPITRFCAISLPKSVTSATHQPFPKNPVTIAGIKNEMAVLPSLQRPRKITFLGSDGKPYDILCKPKDDLRRDARLMEFNNIVNMYLHRDPESRARHLHIRTYVVTPLGESGGLLEWVPKLVGLRPALLQLYKQHGKFVPTRELRKHELQARDPLEKKRTVYLEKLIPLHPPIFYEWFRLTFPDPAGWYTARQAFTRTTAVMSMVGYILGLGDRHGENILFDSESGDTVHVDFNCLFNKGENFDWKERVPFRLTHNMAGAMGPCGVEGTFRKSCETSMRVLRAQGKTLMSVLTPFAYDPFGSWSKNKEIVHQERDQKIAEALEELSDIEKRLNGSLRVKQKNNTFYLSVEGLVRSLITEATSVDNLCQMYLGWGAYL